MHAADLEHRRFLRREVPDEAELGGGAAHVEGDEVAFADESAVEDRGQGAGGGTRLHEPDGEAGGGLDGRDAAVREHQVEARREAGLLQLPLEAVEVAVGQRLDVGVGDGGGGAFELADLGGDLARDRHDHAREPLLEPGAHGVLVLRVGEGVHEHDGARLDALRGELGDERLEAGGVERGEHLAAGVHPLGGLEASVARDQGVGEADLEVVDVVAHLAAQLEDVAEAARGDERGGGALPLEQRVRDERGGVDRGLDVAAVGARGVQQVSPPLHHRARGGLGRGQHLVGADGARLGVDEDEVGERAADVETEAEAGATGEAVARTLGRGQRGLLRGRGGRLHGAP